ncbi:MAG TPA: DUF2079 domain-containing protein, partial [Polyangiaceae bacterium]
FKSSPLGGPDSVHFGFHATVFAYLLVPFYALYQHAETLLLIQAVLIGFAALPLYWFSRDLIGAWPAALLSVVYAVHPAVQSSNLYDFHYTPLAPFFIYLALYALQAKRDILAAVAIALTLSIREDVSASIVIVGAYFFFWGGRPRAGMSVACAGLLYFVALKFFIMPQFGHGETFLYMYKDLVPGQENGFGPVLKTIIGNPAFTLSTLLTEKKLICVLQILVPFAFLPLKRAVGWFLCLPGFFFNLLTTSYDPPITLGFQYAAHWNSFLFAAIAIVLAQEQRPRHPWDVLGGIRKRSWLAAILAGTLVVSYQFGIFFQHHVARAAFDEVHIGFSDAQRERLKTLREIIRLIPPAAKVVASERLLPHLSNRPDAYRLLHAVYDAEYILVDTPNLGREERDHVQDELRRRQFGVILIRGDFMLARRGAPTEKNAEWLQGGHPFARSRRDRGNRR